MSNLPSIHQSDDDSKVSGRNRSKSVESEGAELSSNGESFSISSRCACLSVDVCLHIFNLNFELLPLLFTILSLQFHDGSSRATPTVQ